MWTIIIFTVLGITYGAYLAIRDYDDMIGMSIIIHALLGFLIGGIIAFALPTKKETIKTEYSIESIQDNNSINGLFFLGSGVIDGNMSFCFYYRENGVYRMEQGASDLLCIKYTEGTPKVIKITQRPIKGKIINLFALDFFNDKPQYVAYIPKGSIKQDFNLDAQ